MKYVIILLSFLFVSKSYAQHNFDVNFKEYRFSNDSIKIGSNKNLMKKLLNQQFSGLITGQTKNSIGNFASLDPTDASVSFAGNRIFNNGSVLTVKTKGGVSDGFLPIFKNSKLNTNISLDLQYNMMRLGKRKLLTNVDSTDQYERAIDKIEYDYNLKLAAILSLRDSLQLDDRKSKAKKIGDSIDIVLKAATTAKDKITLQYEYMKADLLYDSLNKALARYDTLQELFLLHNKTIPQLEKLSVQPSVEGFAFGWFSFGYKVTNNSFRLFNPALTFGSQLTDTSFVSHEARVQYSYYDWSPISFHSYYFNVGFAYSYTDNFNSLKKNELSEVTEYGTATGARSQTKKYNAYQGKYNKGVSGLAVSADLFYFLFQNNMAAIHINPEWVTQSKEKPVGNFYTGFLLAFKNAKTDGAVINAELYYKFLDVFKSTDTDYRLFERNNIGIRFSVPIQFKYK